MIYLERVLAALDAARADESAPPAWRVFETRVEGGKPPRVIVFARTTFIEPLWADVQGVARALDAAGIWEAGELASAAQLAIDSATGCLCAIVVLPN